MPRLVVSQMCTGFSNTIHLIPNSGQLKSSSTPELEQSPGSDCNSGVRPTAKGSKSFAPHLPCIKRYPLLVSKGAPWEPRAADAPVGGCDAFGKDVCHHLEPPHPTTLERESTSQFLLTALHIS